MTDEIWDLLDADANPTGKTHVRGVPLPEGFKHLVVSAAVVRRDGYILIAQRAATKTLPLTWEISAGSALTGETSREAASRELREEVGVYCAPDDLTFLGRVVETSADFDMYATAVDGEVDIVVDPEEVEGAKWITLDEFDRMVETGELASYWHKRIVPLRAPLGEFFAANQAVTA